LQSRAARSQDPECYLSASRIVDRVKRKGGLAHGNRWSLAGH